jgi:GH18 family chitinase
MDPTTFEVRPMNPADEDIYSQFMGLSDSVSKWIGLGGWEFSDPGSTRTTWSDMTSSKENRKAFIDSFQQFVKKWGFKGVDIDWEWPAAPERGGNSADTSNQVSLLSEIRQQMGDGFGISVVLPAQLDYLRNMDVKGLEAQADWLNVLTYDLHGPWEPSSAGIKAHTDLHEIEGLLEPLWSGNVDPKKVNLGIANYVSLN